MFDLVIVDDKKAIRDGLKRFIKWDALGFHLAGDFSSATEAIRFIECENVDVLLTDIVMPEMDGLTLIKEAKLINPYIKVVVLSAYEKFEYARQVIRLGAYDYLTKPISLDRVKTLFRTLYGVLTDEQREMHRRKEFSTFAAEQFLNNLVNGFSGTSDEAIRKAEQIGLDLKGDFCALRAVTAPADAPADTEEMPSAFGTQLMEFLSGQMMSYGRIYCFRSSLGEISALFSPSGEIDAKEHIRQTWRDACDRFRKEIPFGVGQLGGDLSSIAESYLEAGKALEYHIIKKNAGVLFFDDISKTLRGKSVVTAEIEKQLLTDLSAADREALLARVTDILDGIRRVEKMGTGALYDSCIEIILIIDKFMTGTMESRKDIEQGDFRAIRTLLKKEDADEIIDYMRQYIGDTCDLLMSNREKSTNYIIGKATRYIDAHYSEEITLNRLSEVVYVNPIYLSRLFKEKLGRNFIDYLTAVRIEHAKKLLSDLSLKIYDITAMVGYESRNHFGKVFKEITGMSPKEYRNSI